MFAIQDDHSSEIKKDDRNQLDQRHKEVQKWIHNQVRSTRHRRNIYYSRKRYEIGHYLQEQIKADARELAETRAHGSIAGQSVTDSIGIDVFEVPWKYTNLCVKQFKQILKHDQDKQNTCRYWKDKQWAFETMQVHEQKIVAQISSHIISWLSKNKYNILFALQTNRLQAHPKMWKDPLFEAPSDDQSDIVDDDAAMEEQ